MSTTRALTRSTLAKRAAILLATGYTLTEIATELALTPPALSRLLATPEAQLVTAAFTARTLSALSSVETAALLDARARLSLAQPTLVSELLTLATSRHTPTPDPSDPNGPPLPPQISAATKLSAITTALTKGGLTTELANSATHATPPPSTTPIEATTELVSALADLVDSLKAPIPSSDPPPLPSHARRLRHEPLTIDVLPIPSDTSPDE